MNPAEEKIWRALDPENGAMLIQTRPVHTFWPLLASSFRWVLLAPHRRAGGAEIVWEWRGPRSDARPAEADLADLRLRLRDGLDLFEEDLRRHSSLPGGISIGELQRGIERTLHDLRHASDSALAAHAVLTAQGWMIRSWGFAKPAPARAESPETNGAPTASPPQAPAPRASTTTRAAPRRILRFRVWKPALVLGLLLAGLGLALLRERGSMAKPHAENTLAPPVPLSKAPVRSPPPDETNLPDAAGAAAGISAKSNRSRALLATERKNAPPLPAHTPEITSTPLAISGRMSSSPEARIAQAGPPSKLPGKDEALPSPTMPRGDSRADAPVARGDAPDSTLPAPPRPDGTNAENNPPAMRGTPPAPPPQAADIREGKIARAQPATPAPAPFSVEAREGPTQKSPLPPLPSRPADAGKAPASRHGGNETSFPAASAETRRASDRPSPPDADSAAQAVLAIPTAGAAETSAVSTAASDIDLRTLFLGHAMPWRVLLERDSPLPTRPIEGNGEAEMRAARIAAWAEARARMPSAFRPLASRAGWSLRLSSEAAAARPLRWRGASGGESLPDGVAATVGGDEAWIAWRETERRDLDASLITADGKTLVRVRRLVAENRIEVRALPAIAELRPWFSLQLKPGADAGGLTAPAGWSLSAGADELVARGPAGALRMRWLHAASGWCAHGGYARENP